MCEATLEGEVVGGSKLLQVLRILEAIHHGTQGKSAKCWICSTGDNSGLQSFGLHRSAKALVYLQSGEVHWT